MNTEATQESNAAAQTTGERLRNAREQRGLSQQAVAERLCLKVSTVKDIEEDKAPAELASTFLRGYIRSYARLVSVPEEELLPMMEKQAPIRASKVEPMQSFSLGKRRKKRDGWLMTFTWLILFVVIGLTGAWWWQNHKAQQAELTSMADQNQSDDGAAHSGNLVPLNTDMMAASKPEETPLPQPAVPATPVVEQNSVVQANGADNHPASSAVVSQSQVSIDNLQTPTSAPGAEASLPTAQANVESSEAHGNGLNMAFNADCWLEVTDSAGKKLFSGLKRKGEKLDLTGNAPYKLKIGAPSAVEIHYQGKPVDLSRFIRTNQVARLTVGAE